MTRLTPKFSVNQLNNIVSLLFIFIFSFDATYQYKPIESKCILPTTWSGIWQNQQQNNFNKQQNFNSQFPSFNNPFFGNDQAKNTISARKIDSITFLDKGSCLNFKDERYFFYDNREKCFRCLFIIQRHHNVLQYRESRENLFFKYNYLQKNHFINIITYFFQS